MTEFSERLDYTADRDLLRAIQGSIDGAVIDGLYKLGLSSVPAVALDQEEQRMLLEASDNTIWNRRAFGEYSDVKSLLSADMLWAYQYEAHQLGSIFPGQWGAVSRIVTMSSPELYGDSGSRLYKSPMKCISLMVGDTKEEVECDDYEEAELYDYVPQSWEILIQPDSPPLIIKAEERIRLSEWRSDRRSPDDGGWIESFRSAQRRDQAEGLGLFRMLSTAQCRELITLVNAAKSGLSATYL